MKYFQHRADAVRRVTWVCGSEQVLVEEVIDHVRSKVGASDFDYVSLVAGATADRDIWAAANQYPVDPKANRLVLVRDVHKIQRWEPLEAWLANSKALPTIHLLLVSGDADFTYQDDALCPPCYWIRHHSAGDLVRCAPLADRVPLGKDRRPTRPGPPDLVKWLQGHAPMEDSTAEYLLGRVGGSLSRARNVAWKARLFPGTLTEQAIDVLCSEEPAEDFVGRLIALDKRAASQAAEFVPPREYSRVIGELEYRLNVVGQVYDLIRQRKTMRDAASIGLPVYVAKQVWGSAKHYDESRQLQCRKLLSVVDEYVQAGPQTGQLEGLVALW